jgi:ACS family tartrate transporter-like MFS transporter
MDRAVVSKVTRHLLPLLSVSYILVYIVRINVGYAGLQLQRVLGVDAAAYDEVYGLGAGIFSLGYCLFQVPSNLVLQRVGARRWIACILIASGAVSSAMVFVRSPAAFYAMRFCLGAATAGLFPGALLALTAWYRARDRARAVALFATASTLAGLLGSPLSGVLLELDGRLGLDGWQWLVLVESLPLVIAGIVVRLRLPDRPAEAPWLSAEEKAWIEAEVEAEAARPEFRARRRLRDAFASRRVWLLAAAYFLLNMGGYAFELWLPRLVEALCGAAAFQIGLIGAVPYLLAAAAMVMTGRHSDRTGERRRHVAAAAFAGALGFALSARVATAVPAIAALTLAFVGIKSVAGPFWALGTAFLSGTAAAGGIAWINCVGNLGGFAGPYLVGRLAGGSHDYAAAFAALAAALLGVGILALCVRAMATTQRDVP